LSEPHSWYLKDGEDIVVEANLVNGFYVLEGGRVRDFENCDHDLRMF
jgi:hypothetical protein